MNTIIEFFNDEGLSLFAVAIVLIYFGRKMVFSCFKSKTFDSRFTSFKDLNDYRN